MSKRKTATAILLLSLGIVMVPGGFIVNDFIQDLTYSSVDEGLRGIKAQGVPLVIEKTLELGPMALALTFDLILEQGLKFSKPLVDATMFMGQAYIVQETLPFLVVPKFFDFLAGPLGNFSSVAEGFYYPSIQGISEWYGTDLNFSIYDDPLIIWPLDLWGGTPRLMFGTNTTEQWWGDRLPGIFEDTYRRVGDTQWPPDNYTDSYNIVDMNQDRGFGVMEMMEIIENADETEIKALCGEYGYNLSNPEDKFEYNGQNYTKLEILYYYFNDYFSVEVLQMIIEKFNEPTANPIYNPLFYTYPQYQMRDWNGNDTSYEDIMLYSFIEQWAKCNNFDNGFEFYDAEPSVPAGIYGLEPGGPVNSSGIPMQAALQIWNKSNENSILNVDGIYKWYDAYYDSTTYNELLSEFSQFPGYDFENDTYGEADWGFNDTDMDLILDWLWGNGGEWNQGSFYEVTLPLLLTEEIAFQILLEQWAYGTIRGIELYPGGFPLPLGSNIVYGFELGFQGPNQKVIPAQMSIETALALWDTSSVYSLTTKLGIEKWFAALMGDSNAYPTLQSEFGLTDFDMYLILNWIPDFQHNVMPYLAQYQYSLPSDSISLGNIVEIAFVGLGAVCIGLGAMGMGGYIVTRKIAAHKPEKEFDPFKLGKKMESKK
ncbi:MAG: hypothetical protein ACFFBP_17755 [Promethearchaeota archaeon]